MKKNELKKAGVDILLVNVILILFILSEERTPVNCLIASISTSIAIILNGYILIKFKSKWNYVTCFLNGGLFLFLLGYTILQFISN